MDGNGFACAALLRGRTAGRGAREDDEVGTDVTNEDDAVPTTTLTGEAEADWRHQARCRHADPETLFVQGAQQRDAREVCRACPVRTECLAHALDNRIRFGVWGGMTERERRALLRKRPEVISWAALLESARQAAQRSPAARAGATRTARAARAAQPVEVPAPRRPGDHAQREVG